MIKLFIQPNLIFTAAFMLISIYCRCQQNNDYDYVVDRDGGGKTEFLLNGSVGVSLPVEDYARAGLSQPNPGYMTTGYALNLELEWFGKYNVGTFMGLLYNNNRLRSGAFTEMLRTVNDPLEIGDVIAGNAYEVSFIAGIAIRQNMGQRWDITAKFGAGLTYSRFPGLAFSAHNSAGDEFRINRIAHENENFTAIGELKPAYSIGARTKVFAAIRYHTGRFEHNNVSLRTTQVRTGNQITNQIDEVKNLKVVHVALGLSFTL